MKAAIRLFIGFSIGTWVQAVLSLISIPVITWLISPSELGKATMFTVAYNLLLQFVLLGANQSFIRFFSESNDAEKIKLFRESLISPLLFLSFLSLILYPLREDISLFMFLSKEEDTLILFLIGALFVGVLLQFGLTLIRMKSKAIAYSSLQVLMAVSNITILISHAILINASFKSVILGFIGSSFLALLASLYIERTFWIASVLSIRKFDSKLISQILWYGLPFVPTFLADWVFQSTDRVFLRIYASYTEIGLYAAGTKVANSLNIIKNGFTAYWVPYSYEKFAENPSNKIIYSKTFNLLSLVLFTAVIVMISLTDIILKFLPESYSHSAKIFPILFFVPLLYTLSEVTSVGINFKKKPYLHLIIVIASAVTNLIFGFIFIPEYGAVGAAISTLIAYIVYFILRSSISINLYYVNYDWLKFSLSLLLAFSVLVFDLVSANNLKLWAWNLFSLILTVFIYSSDLLMILQKLKGKTKESIL